MPKLRVGDVAPDFELKDQGGRTVSLHDFRGSKNVVLYFYPKDFTTGCTAETRKFGEEYDKLLQLGAEVIGISSDDEESHMRFAAQCSTRFPLLADRGGQVRARYGVESSLGMIPGRVTFVIDRDGIVKCVFSSQLNPRKHVAEAIQALKAEPDRHETEGSSAAN
ncbi:MAG: peroxiredoxin [Nitrososphaerales archaeon]|nr:peroxiredoxin [Nitrososphaerales archaeon]